VPTQTDISTPDPDGWRSFSVVHAVKIRALEYHVELSDGHIYLVRNAIANWLPGEQVRLRSQWSALSHKMYYALGTPLGVAVEVTRLR
jgi:hypothetical protein